MTTPITPQFAIDSVVLHSVNILYNPVWDGAAWVLTPADIKIDGIGNTATLGNNAAGANVQMNATDLPPAGQAALQDLYTFVEQAIADEYA